MLRIASLKRLSKPQKSDHFSNAGARHERNKDKNKHRRKQERKVSRDSKSKRDRSDHSARNLERGRNIHKRGIVRTGAQSATETVVHSVSVCVPKTQLERVSSASAESAVAAYSDASSLLLPETLAAPKSCGPRIEIECMGGEGISMAVRVGSGLDDPAGRCHQDGEVIYRRQLLRSGFVRRQETALTQTSAPLKHEHLLLKVTTSPVHCYLCRRPSIFVPSRAHHRSVALLTLAARHLMRAEAAPAPAAAAATIRRRRACRCGRD